ncbi:MAG: peptide/nickel transport system ATP-binding protein [Natronomonas sp.]|jgi:peptide/nickel transport system ATP-binding protein
MATGNGDPLIEVRNVSKYFDQTASVTDRLLRRDPQPVRAVEDVSLTIDQGDIIGIAGESGCGKTTLGNMLVKLYPPTEGEIIFDGQRLADMSRSDEREFRQRVQMIFQDPFESLNPRMTVLDSVVEPLKINDMGETYQQRRNRAIEVLDDVGLSPAEQFLDQYPGELSGGERQRVAVARALVVDPDFIVADEPVSMLDVSIRASVLNLMRDLQDEYDLTYLFVSHDLALIRYMTDETGIMYLGDIVEYGDTTQIVENPQHPYTKALFDAVPVVDPQRERRRANVAGEIPSPRNPPSGCKFHPRCPEVIPPDNWTGDQDAYRRFVMFQSGLRDREIGPGSLEGLEVDLESDEAVRMLLERELALDVPQEHRQVDESPEAGVDVDRLSIPPDAMETLRQAARNALQENYEAALDRIGEEYRSVCATEHPGFRTAAGRQTACHLYDGETEDSLTSATSSADD